MRDMAKSFQVPSQGQQPSFNTLAHSWSSVVSFCCVWSCAYIMQTVLFASAREGACSDTRADGPHGPARSNRDTDARRLLYEYCMCGFVGVANIKCERRCRDDNPGPIRGVAKEPSLSTSLHSIRQGVEMTTRPREYQRHMHDALAVPMVLDRQSEIQIPGCRQRGLVRYRCP